MLAAFARRGGGAAAQRPLHGAAARGGGTRRSSIGGGFSGLAAAYELSKAGYDVTVAEARNRVGGRVISFSDLVAGKNVEGGGELIGSNHPAWVGYAKQFGLKFLDVSEEDLEAPIVLGGKRLTVGRIRQRSGKRWKRRSTRSSPTPPRSTPTSRGRPPTPRRSTSGRWRRGSTG